jgi:geranylgeranyl diphosphate synthase type I
VFGINPAILAGDALLVLAVDVLAGSGHPAATEAIRMLTAAVQDLFDGQDADLSFERRAEVELAECVRMAEGKTAALIGCACALGALFGDGRPDQVAHLLGFGMHLGLAFQHVDDLLGIWGDPAVTGKPAFSDLQQAKKTLPVIAALRSGTAAGTLLAEALDTAPDRPGEEDLRAQAALIERAGGRDHARELSVRHLGQAVAGLTEALPPSPARDELTGLFRFVVTRDARP